MHHAPIISQLSLLLWFKLLVALQVSSLTSAAT